jgi:hypothetical protein
LLLLVRLPELQVRHAQPSGQRGIADGRRCHACWSASTHVQRTQCQRGLLVFEPRRDPLKACQNPRPSATRKGTGGRTRTEPFAVHCVFLSSTAFPCLPLCPHAPRLRRAQTRCCCCPRPVGPRQEPSTRRQRRRYEPPKEEQQQQQRAADERTGEEEQDNEALGVLLLRTASLPVVLSPLSRTAAEAAALLWRVCFSPAPASHRQTLLQSRGTSSTVTQRLLV